MVSWFRSSPAKTELEVPTVPVELPQRPVLPPIFSLEVLKLLEQRDIVDLTESVLQNGSFPCYGRDSDMAALSAHKELRRLTVETAKGPISYPARSGQALPKGDLPRVPALGEDTDALRHEFGGGTA